MDDDDADYYEDPPLAAGHIEIHEQPASTTPAAVLWLPDPEARHGWREHYVTRPQPTKRKPPIGFPTSHTRANPRRTRT